MIKLIVGLANPGLKYIMTRHNVGSWYINHLAYKYKSLLVNDDYFCGNIGFIKTSCYKICLLIPSVFINLSGYSIVTVTKFYNIELKEILVVHDDLNLPCGVIKFKCGGGHGGHNGVKSIIKELDNQSDFNRLRIGIGRPDSKDEIREYVLGKPSKLEQKIIVSSIKKITKHVDSIISNNKLNF